MTTHAGTESRPDPTILARNLAAIARRSPIAARAIGASAGREGAAFFLAPDGGVTGTLVDAGAKRQLASAHRPIEEGKRLADSVAVADNAAAVVLGFGLGHHCRALAERLRFTGVIIAFEPDVALLREVLSRVDHSAWIVRTNFVLLTDADDAGAIAAGMSGVEGLVVLGTRLVEHPPSKARLGRDADRFAARLAEVVRAVRTTVMTTMVHSPVTLRNLVMNADHYSACPGIADLAGAAAGKPAIVVAAGPSLHRNIHLLSGPGVREKFVIIAVQTVLKTLLERGIRPHFVTALDHADLSTRFYEGLTARDVEGVALVVEPKANAAILDAYPGEVRCARDPLLDTLLGPALARERGQIKAGATVAHMAYYLARHLGCDPVIFVGQDLGFTDGQYYHAHAAIHQVWSGELNDFNTLEMLEWQRIVRARAMLHRATDVLGRPIYTDEQMTTYLAQFERDFLHDAQQGLSIVDATEGGVRKRHTGVMTLQSALDAFARDPVELPRARAKAIVSEAARDKLLARLREIRTDARRIESLSDQTAALLDRLARVLDQPRKANAIIAEVYDLRDQVHACAAALELVQFVNQTGALNRFKADRAIEMDDAQSPAEIQRRRVARDTTNVRWIAEAARHVGELLDKAIDTHRGGTKVTRDQPAPDVEVARQAVRVLAHLHVDAERAGLGTRRDLAAPLAGGKNALQLTLARLARARRLDGVVITSDDPERARAIAGPEGKDATFVGATRPPRRHIEVARLVARRCWRGGLGNAAVFDEVFDPHTAHAAIAATGAAAIVPVGPDWPLIDAALIDACIERHQQNPGAMGLVFTPAPPGLAICVVGAALAAELHEKADAAGTFGTLGALLGYIPVAPQADPIARSACVPAPAVVRDGAERLIADTPAGLDAVRYAIHELGARAATASAELIASTLAARPRVYAPEVLTLSLTNQRRTRALRSAWLGEPANSGLAFERAKGAIDTFLHTHAQGREGVVVSLEGAGDPLLHARWREIVAHAKAAGAVVHLRTELLGDPHTLELVRDADIDIVSVDLLADTPETYRRITGLDEHARAVENIQSLLAARGRPRAPAWVVPRLTRCDEVYAEIESFYDRWIMSAGWCVIDPMPRAIDGSRVAPLPRPACVEARDLSTRAFVEVVPPVFPLTPAQAAGLIEQKAAQHEPAA
ncbi:MAG: DUF115 domain-containing protein [Phycisphaerae bacterium]|nr:DUF115 domain-containing protein [Phycisphaerae bacterium]